MPVFGKGRKGRERRDYIGKEVRRGLSRRLYGVRKRYFYVGASGRLVRAEFPLIFGKNDFVRRRFCEIGKPVVVLDWGCGKGNAIRDFAENYGKKIRAYGFSKDSYKKWLKIENVKFIHASAEDLFRYLKNGSIDLVYSRTGLMYLFPPTKKQRSSERTIEKGVQYIEMMLKKVSKRGKIVFDTPLLTKKQVREALEKALAGRAEVECYTDAIYITKK